MMVKAAVQFPRGYIVEQDLGDGPIGRVALAVSVDERDALAYGDRCVLTKLHPALVARPGVRRFLYEIQSGRAVTLHPNLVPLFGIEELESDSPIVVTGLPPGIPFASWLESGSALPIPQAIAISIVRDLLRGLAELHHRAQGAITHGCVGAHALFFDKDGRVALSAPPLGLLAAIADEEPAADGSFPAVSPPTAAEETAQVGLLGCLLFESLMTSNSPSPLRDWLEQATSEDGSKRFRSADEMLLALEALPDCVPASQEELATWIRESATLEDPTVISGPPALWTLHGAVTDSKRLQDAKTIVAKRRDVKFSAALPQMTAPKVFDHSEEDPTRAVLLEEGDTFLPPPVTDLTPDMLVGARLQLKPADEAAVIALLGGTSALVTPLMREVEGPTVGATPHVQAFVTSTTALMPQRPSSRLRWVVVALSFLFLLLLLLIITK